MQPLPVQPFEATPSCTGARFAPWSIPWSAAPAQCRRGCRGSWEDSNSSCMSCEAKPKCCGKTWRTMSLLVVHIAFLIDKDRWEPVFFWVSWSFWTRGGNVDFCGLQSHGWKGWQETSNNPQVKMLCMCPQWWVLPGHLNKLMAGMEHSWCMLAVALCVN